MLRQLSLATYGSLLLKPGCHMSGISQTIGDFAVSRPFQILTGTNRENRKRFYFSDSSLTILDHRGCLRFMVFISWENLGRSGNCEIPDRFSRHMNTRLNP